MIFKKMLKNLITINILSLLLIAKTLASSDYPEFDSWVKNFKKDAINEGISKKVVEELMSEAKFLPKVIEYDRYQPEFYESTEVYIKKRSNKNKVKKGMNLYWIALLKQNMVMMVVSSLLIMKDQLQT